MQSEVAKAKEEEKYVDESEPEGFIEIDELQNQGIGMGDLNKLKGAGICTVMGVLMCTKKELLNIKGISEQKLDKILEAAQKVGNSGFKTGLYYEEKRKKLVRISTGSTLFDQLLGGGIETQAITEAFGEFRCGKTQLSHTLCVTAQLPKNMGGGCGKVIFIDTECTFRPERIRSIAERFELDPEQALENIKVAEAWTVDRMNQLISQAAAIMMEDSYALMIVDSIMAPFRVDFSGRGELSERQQVLGKTLSRLHKLAEQFNIAVFMTNQVMADPGMSMAYAADPKKPIGGNIMAHASTTRLYLRKGRAETRVCKIYDSPCLPEGECIFAITDGGIADATE